MQLSKRCVSASLGGTCISTRDNGEATRMKGICAIYKVIVYYFKTNHHYVIVLTSSSHWPSLLLYCYIFRLFANMLFHTVVCM